MARRQFPNLKNRAATQLRAATVARSPRTGAVLGKRFRGADRGRFGPSLPPEDWHEPTETGNSDYRVIVQDPGAGHVHVVTADEVRARLAKLPAGLLQRLEVVQLSRMTRRKRSFPCYGMQWGSAIYLYPMEESLVEYYVRPPVPSELQEAAMFGARWMQESPGVWALNWTQTAIRDFYLNNVLIHELGHILDDRNSSHVDRERYAEWFAIEYGYKPSRAELARQGVRRVIRRRHGAE